MAYREYFIVQDNPEYLAFCEDENLDPWEEDSELEWRDQQEDKYTNPHG